MWFESGAMVALMLVMADVWAIFHVRAATPDRLIRLVWLLILSVLPGLGLLLWLLAGPAAGPGPAVQRA